MSVLEKLEELVGYKEHKAHNDAPTIGIYSIPSTPSDTDTTQIPASYVKWIESAGGRVVPLPFIMTEAQVKEKLDQLNGVLFTGGLGHRTDNFSFVLNYAIELNKKGDYFPVWGTCLGSEWILEVVGELKSLAKQFDSENIPLPLHFTDYGRESCRIFKSAPKELMKIYAHENVAFNHHQSVIKPTTFHDNHHIANFFHVISTSKDRVGVEFVSMYESKHFPIYGSQWHPEKNMYEFGKNKNGEWMENIPHTKNARWAAQWVVDFFVDECRKSSHKFSSLQEEDAALIYSYPVTKTTTTAYEQTYVFKW